MVSNVVLVVVSQSFLGTGIELTNICKKYLRTRDIMRVRSFL